MPAGMADLPDCAPLYVTNTQRRRAALVVAERCAADPAQLVAHLLTLGLAERRGDVVVSVPDPVGEDWFVAMPKPYN